MEEVWKDITLTTLHQERPITSPNHQSYHRPASSSSLRAMTLEGFLAGPLNRPLTLSPPAVEEMPLRPPPPPPALPQTALSLNSGMEFQCLGPHADSRSNSSSNGQHASFIARPPSGTGLFSFCSKKRWPEKPATGVDRQHRRMIKNRESAARSRARKQAYTNQLELEVSHLKEENAKLKKQYEELRSAMATKLPKRNTFRRSSTAPF